MTTSRLYAMSLVCAGLALAASPSFGSSKTPAKTVNVPSVTNYQFVVQTKNGPKAQRKPWIPTAPATAEERAKATAEASSKKEPTIKKASASMWTSQYTLYVNCPTAPADVNFADIQTAVDFALPYTTIKVCYGNYLGNIDVYTSYIKIVGEGDHYGDQNILDYYGNDGAQPTDGSYGVVLLGSYDVVENLTFINQEFGVGTSILIQNQDNVVDHNWFNDVSFGVGSIGGSGTLVENNVFTTNVYPIVAVGGVNETFTCNTVTGDEFAFDSDGIAIYDSVSSTVTSNVVSNTEYGLDFEFFNSLATVEKNHFDGNYIGIAIQYDNSGNLFEKNQANGNQIYGIASDASSGLDSTPNSGVNKFIKNTTLGNYSFGGLDILDDTAPYTGFSEGNNDETADYYSGNTGDLYSSYPIDIYQQ